MDHFGIGAAIRAAALFYDRAARGTGRTTSMVDSVKDGDRIVFALQPEAVRVQRLCQERSVKVECIVISPSNPERLFERGPSKGRTIFDHTWVQRHYENALDCAARSIDLWQTQASGHGEAHRETERAAEQYARFQV